MPQGFETSSGVESEGCPNVVARPSKGTRTMPDEHLPLEKETSSPSTRISDTFSAFRKEIDHLFERFSGTTSPFDKSWPSVGLRGLPFEGIGESFLVPDVDIHENDKQLTLTAELPGLEEKDMELTLKDGIPTLKGEKKCEFEDMKDDTHMLERSYGKFVRSFTLPTSVDQNKLKARFDKGLLKITMPKRKEANKDEKKIPISV